MAKKSKPYYGEKTKKKIVEDYFRDSVTIKELSELYGVFGRNRSSGFFMLSNDRKKEADLKGK